MTEKSLKYKAASGMIWVALQKYSTMFIQFISGIILARLLTPHDYGCIGMLSIFLVLAESFIEGGFDSALIQKKNPTQIDYSTIFFWSLGMAAFMYLLLFISAPIISRFYRMPLLCDVLRVQGLILFVYAFNVIQRNQLRKKLNFKLLSIVTIGSSFVSLSITVVMAYKGFGVWSLVAQQLLLSTISAVTFWFYVKWRPIFTFSWNSFKELFSFGVYMFMSHLLHNFSTQFRGLLIGKVYSSSVMGYYSKAFGTEKMASQSISAVLNQVTFPLYSEVQDDLEAMKRMIIRLSTSVAYLTFPLMSILILIAKPLFILLYSERWNESIPYFQILCLVGLGVCLQSVNLQTISAIGKSKIMFLWSFVKQGVGIVFVVSGLYFWGMKGLLVGIVFHSWNCALINMLLVSKYIGYKTLSQLKDLLPIASVSLLSFTISYLIGLLTDLNTYLDGMLKLLVFCTIYICWSLFFKPASYIYIRDIVISRKRKK